jgi:hypothetical protein
VLKKILESFKLFYSNKLLLPLDLTCLSCFSPGLVSAGMVSSFLAAAFFSAGFTGSAAGLAAGVAGLAAGVAGLAAGACFSFFTSTGLAAGCFLASLPFC